MCGIVGYIGKKQAKNLLLNCLEKLEYRGYDSAGIAVSDNQKLKFLKTKGRVWDLKTICDNEDLEGFAGIAHTRWATHGEPSTVNSHPHFNADKTIAVVHNGIIENYEVLRKELIEKGYQFKTDTDTEVIPHLIDYYYKGDILDAVFTVSKKLEGSYAIGVLCADEPHKIIATKKDSPLVVGVGADGNFISSDPTALLSETKEVYYMDDNEFAVTEQNKTTFFDCEKNIIKKQLNTVNYTPCAAEKAGFEHFMLKEIFEQPNAINDTICGRISENKPVSLDGINPEKFKNIQKIYIVGCGTAYHSAVVGKYVTEKLSGIPTEADYASEFRYRSPIIDNKTLVIAITQSGETADTLAALKSSKKAGAKVLAITNVKGSTVSREADYVFYTYAGPEIAVASTKAYLTQIASIYIFAIFMAEITKHTSSKTLNEIKNELLNIPCKIKETLLLDRQIKDTASQIFNHKDIYYLGRGLDYAVAMEGSLKLKETSYIHSEAYAGGELKHGPIALIDKGTTVIAVNTNRNLSKKTDSNIKEVISRGAKVICITPCELKECATSFDKVFLIPDTNDILYPLISSIPLQLLAYHISVYKNCDVDKPRNLAKSVTVE